MKVVGLLLVGLLAVAAVPMPEGETVLLERRSRRDTAPVDTDEYQIGVGKADITGPVGGKVSGYDLPESSTTWMGRSYARAFAFYQENDKPVVFAVAERYIVSNYVYNLVWKDLKSVYPDLTRNHLVITATHTHSASHVWSDYAALQISSGTYPAGLSDKIYAKGLISAIKDALEMAKVTKGKIKHFTLADGSANNPKIAIQRSHAAFEANAQGIKDILDPEQLNTDMTFLKFEKDDGTAIGMINWFNVQGTSMNRENHVLSAGNKGIAAALFERKMEESGSAGFVAAFANGGYGDSSPNVAGATCKGTDTTCDFGKTTVTYSELTKVVQFDAPGSNCSGNYQDCQAYGPLAETTKDGAANMIETGRRQFNKAQSVWDNSGTAWTTVKGDVESATTYFNIRTADPPCPAAIGFSYLAGTIDGTVLDTTVLNLGAAEREDMIPEPDPNHPNAEMIRTVIDMVKDWLAGDISQAKACQGSKHILVADMTGNYTFFPAVASTSVISIGNGEDSFVIGGVPVSPTAASAHQMAEEIKKEAGDHRRVVITAPTNDYIGYATTEEEYSVQRYEGAATVYGPKTTDKFASKIGATMKCIEDDNCAAHLAFDAPECMAGVTPDNCPPFFDELAASRLTTTVQMGVDLAKQHGLNLEDENFQAQLDDKRGQVHTQAQGVGTNSVSAVFFVSGKWTIDNVGKTFCEVQCARGRRFSTVLTDVAFELSSRFYKSGNDLLAQVTWNVPESFNSGKEYNDCKIGVHTYDAMGENEKGEFTDAFDAPNK